MKKLNMQKERKYLAELNNQVEVAQKDFEKTEIINDFMVPWITGMNEIEGNLARMKRAWKSEDVSRLYKEALQLELSVEQGLKKSKDAYNKFIRL